jgi:hypothetical protein
MFKAILYTQWKWSRAVVMLSVVIAFTLPIMSVQRAGITEPSRWETQELLHAIEMWSVWYTLLAAGLGLLVATTAWAQDHRGRHVYALSLPIPRWHYAMLRFAAGSLLLAAPVVALWIGALLATATAQIPPGLNAYPNALALRFALAAFVAYSVFFAISAGTTRTAGYVLAVVGALVVTQVMMEASGMGGGLVEVLFDRVITWPGPLEIFTGRWMLIDV